jgi:hypothetical protein
MAQRLQCGVGEIEIRTAEQRPIQDDPDAGAWLLAPVVGLGIQQRLDLGGIR